MEQMERGERGGVVLDGGEPSDGGEIDAAIKENSQVDEPINESGDAANSNAGAEVVEDGKDAGAAEDEIDSASPGAGEEVAPQLDIDAIKETIRAELKGANEKLPEPVKPLSEEQWVKLEEEWGTPRQTIQKITNQNVQVVNKLMEYIDSKFAKIEVGDVISSVSKEAGFTDATRYRNEIKEFLGDYDPKYWANPILIKKAVTYARGLHAGTNLQKVRVDAEKNKKIAGVARPSSPSGGMKRTAMPALSGAHREVANMMGSDVEYNKFRSRPSRQIE